METITSKSNDKIKLLSALKTDSAKRRETGLFFLEGARLCLDAALSDIEITALFVTPKALLHFEGMIEQIREKADTFYQIDDNILSKVSDTKNSQGIFCICKMLDKIKDIYKMDYNGKYIALEELSDPSNLGSVARSAEAFGLSGIIVSGGCDIYNPKAQRAAMGSLLRLPVFEADSLSELFTELSSKGMKTYAAVLSADSQDISQADFTGGTVCAIGNEGNGLTAETAAAASERIIISMKGKTESLNAGAAAAVIMWEMMK